MYKYQNAMDRENELVNKKQPKKRKQKSCSPVSLSNTTNKPIIDDDAQESNGIQPKKRKRKLIRPGDEMVAKPKRSKKVCRTAAI